MVISKKAVEEFLDRPMRDSGVTKRIPEEELDRRIREEGLQFHTPPRRAQKVCILLGWRYPSYFFLLDTGGGKTWVSLNLFHNLRRVGKASRMLVLVPNYVNLEGWEEQVREHTPDLNSRALDVKGRSERMALLSNPEHDIVIATYQGIIQLCSESEPGKKGRNEWKRSDKLTDQIARNFDVIVLDESTAIRTHNSLPFQVVRRMRKTIPYCYGLTATPHGKDPEALWSQFFVVDDGYTMGETIGLYRSAFYTAKEGYWGGVEYEFRKRMTSELQRRIVNRSVRYKASECQDLPPAVGGISGKPLLVRVPLPKGSVDYYKATDTEFQTSLGSYELARSPYMRMRMITAGYLGTRTDEGEKVEFEFEDNPKLDALIDKLLEIPEEEKAVVVHFFSTSGKIIADRLKKEKISFAWVYGKTSPKKKTEGIASFNDPKGVRVLLGSTAISKGVNLQKAANYMLFYDQLDDPIERYQMERRIQREGGEGTCFFYDFVCKNRIDEKILRSVREGRSFLDTVVDKKK